MPYSLYEDLCAATLVRQDNGFSHFFLTTQWNLMCRTQSVETLCTEHPDVRNACISTRTQQSYTSSLRTIANWINQNKQNPERFFDTTGAINLERFTPSDLEAFLLARRQSVTVSTLNGYRSAIKVEGQLYYHT